MDKQIAFNKVWNGLKSQGWRRSVEFGNNLCMFRGANNTKCAVGHLIPDQLYTEEMESNGMDTLDGEIERDGAPHRAKPLYNALCRELQVSELTFEDLHFLKSMQKVHDNSSASTLEKNFLTFAKSNNLAIPE